MLILGTKCSAIAERPRCRAL